MQPRRLSATSWTTKISRYQQLPPELCTVAVPGGGPGEQNGGASSAASAVPPLVAFACAKPPASHDASAVPLVSAFAVDVHLPAAPSADAWAVPDPLAMADALARESALASALPDSLALAVALDFESALACALPDPLALAVALAPASALASALPISVAIAFDLPCVSELALASPPVFAIAFDLPPVSALAAQALPSVPVCETLWLPLALHVTPPAAWALAAANAKNAAPVSNPIVVFGSFTGSPPASLICVISRSSRSNRTIWCQAVLDIYMTGFVV